MTVTLNNVIMNKQCNIYLTEVIIVNCYANRKGPVKYKTLIKGSFIRKRRLLKYFLILNLNAVFLRKLLNRFIKTP